MFKVSNLVAPVAAALAFAAAPASAVVLDFEDLAGSKFFASLPSNYAGMTWAANFWAYDNFQSPYTAHSGVVRLASNGDNAGDSSFSFGGDVAFDGAWFAGRTFVAFELYDNGNLVHTTGTLGLSETPMFLASGYAGAVDLVKIVANDITYVMDDLAYSTQAVPEPETYALMLAGLGVVGCIVRRRSRAR